MEQKEITIQDVINGNYTDRDIQNLNTAERYATTTGLSQVNEDNFEIFGEVINCNVFSWIF